MKDCGKTLLAILAEAIKIRMAFVDPDYTKRLDPEEIIATLAQMAKQ